MAIHRPVIFVGLMPCSSGRCSDVSEEDTVTIFRVEYASTMFIQNVRSLVQCDVRTLFESSL